MTAPYLPAAAALIKDDHEQRVSLTLTAGAQTWTMGLLGGDLTLSEDWAPRGQLSVVIPNLFTLADLAAIDPRTSTVTAVVTAGYVHPDGTVDSHTLFTGHLVERKVSNGNTVTLEAATAEALTLDAGWMETALFQSFPGVTEALEYFAGYGTGSPVSIDSSVGPGYRADLTGSLPVTPGAPVWTFMADLALAANLRLYVDPAGVWTLRPKATAAGSDVTELTNMSGTEDTLSRKGYYAAALLKYEWTDAMGAGHVIYGRYGSATGPVHYEELATAVTQAAANSAAQAKVRNLSTRGDSYSGTAPAAYWLRPESTVRVSLASGADVNHLVKQVVFHLVNGTMTTTTREPSNLG